MTQAEYYANEAYVSKYHARSIIIMRQMIHKSLQKFLDKVKYSLLSGMDIESIKKEWDTSAISDIQTNIISEWSIKPAEKQSEIINTYISDIGIKADVDLIQKQPEKKKNAAISDNPISGFGLEPLKEVNTIENIKSGKYTKEEIVESLSKLGIPAIFASAFWDYAKSMSRKKLEEMRKKSIDDLTKSGGLLPAIAPYKKGGNLRELIRPTEVYLPGRGITPSGGVAYTAEFYRRFDLSERIWEAAKEQQEKVFSVIEGGRALGRDVKDIANDLDILLKYRDGGKRVKGRWLDMIPDKDIEIETNKIIEQNGWSSFNDQELREARKQAIKNLHKNGWKLKDHPDAVRYYKRLGTSGLDYRTMRVARTQTQFMLEQEAVKTASNTTISTGRVEWILSGRAHECDVCKGYARESKRRGGFPISELPPVPHPNCSCNFRPILKPIDQVISEAKK